MNFKKIFLLFLIIFFIGNFIPLEKSSGEKNQIQIDFFYSSICSHCLEEKNFLQELKNKCSFLQIKEYELISKNGFPMKKNIEILKGFYERFRVPVNEQTRVPITFIQDKFFIGFNNEIKKQIKNSLKEIDGSLEKCLSDFNNNFWRIKAPIFGEIDLSKISLFSLTIALGILDGFNPCAMWVLIVLISLLLSLKSRKKIMLVGGIFIFSEYLLYFLFMTAWLNLFLSIRYIYLIRILIGIFGIVFGIWRIRDFFLWKPGVCKISDHSASQEKIVQKMKNILKPSSFLITIIGVLTLAFGVNIIEFLCSAGFPVLYTKILSFQHLPIIQYYLYLIFYNIFYILDDLIVFGFALLTLSRFNFSDRYNRYSTLVAGLLILLLGILLIFQPKFLIFG